MGKKLVAILAAALAAFLAASILTVLALRWIDPPSSSFMIQHWLSDWLKGGERPYLYHEWVDLEAIAPAAALAVLAAEDQRFSDHRGFDLVEIQRAWSAFREGGRLRGASTITQQLAKNLFLWRARTIARKGLEAWFTLLIELSWPKRRILEVYLNVAQFGPDTFGVGAASWRFFDRPAVALTAPEAALLAAVLPNPERFHARDPSVYVRNRAAWVRKQMRHLDGPALRRLGL